MKLRTQMLAAPALTAGTLLLALVMFLAVQSFAQDRNEALRKANDAADIRTTSVQVELADSLARVYRTICIVASLSGPEVQKVRDKLRADIEKRRARFVQPSRNTRRISNRRQRTNVNSEFFEKPGIVFMIRERIKHSRRRQAGVHYVFACESAY